MFYLSTTRRGRGFGLGRLAWVLVLLCGPVSPESAPAQTGTGGVRSEGNVIQTSRGPREVALGPRTPVGPALSGYHGEVVVAADPESATNLIVCGFRADQRTGSAYEGYVYQSSDSGNTWREVLVDATSQWVSEESCAFGPNHLAYFATGVADTSHGVPQYGRMQLYRSADGGRSWQTIQVDRFLDYMSLAVNTTQSSQRGSLYIFANDLDDGTGNNFIDKIPFLATRQELPALRFSVTSGNFNASETGVKFPGKYPTNSTVLRDGSVLAIFPGDREVTDVHSGKKTTLFSVQLGISRDSGKTLDKVYVYESVVPSAPTGLTVNPVTGEIYIAWTPRYGRRDDSNLMLGTSRDGGNSWTVKSVKPPAGPALDVRAGTVSIASNKDGVLGFLWYGKDGDRVYFGASIDGGDSIAKVSSLTPASPVSSRDGQWVDDRRLFVYPPAWNAVSNRQEPLKILALGPNLAGVPFGNALVADPSGVFHAVWSEVANGPTNLWTRTISLREDAQTKTSATLNGFREVSDRVVTHISNVRYDRLEDLVAFDLTVTNKSQSAIPGPIIVGASSATRDEQLSTSNSDAVEPGGGALWELPIPAETLDCEHSTDPRTLTFRMTPRDEDELDIPLKVYAKLP